MQVLGSHGCATFMLLLAGQNAFASGAAYLTSPPIIVSVNGVAQAPIAGQAADATAGSSKYPLPIGGEEIYSDLSLRNREEGTCVLRLTVSAENKVIFEQLETRTGFPRLDESCLKLVHGRKFAAARKNGVPAETVVTLSVAWMLNDSRAAARETESSRLREQHKRESHTVPIGATGRAIRVLAPDPDSYTGDRVNSSSIVQILLTEEPCALSIEGAEKMHRLWTRQGIDQVGCWYPTLDDKFVSIDGGGHMRKSIALWEIYPRALLLTDGSALIIEPDYDSNTFSNKVVIQKMKRLADRLPMRTNDAP
jgi:hypothetical protein